MSVTLFAGATLPAAPAAYAQSEPMLITGERVLLYVTAIVTTPGPIDFFIEQTDEHPRTGNWFREVAEEDSGGGVTEMPQAVRTLRAEGSPVSNLAAGTHRAVLVFVRAGQFARILARMRSGAASLQITSPNGQAVALP